MRKVTVRKRALHEPESENDLRGKPPHELLGMMWQLTLDAWAFKEKLNAEPRLQRHVVVFARRGVRSDSNRKAELVVVESCDLMRPGDDNCTSTKATLAK